MTTGKARVVEVRSRGITAGQEIRPDEATKMLRTAFDHLSDTGAGLDWLDSVFLSRATIGVKVNVLAGKAMSTSPALVYALVDLLAKFGQKKKDVIIWDRRERELMRAGYELRTSGSGPLCFATDTVGVGFSRELYTHGSIGSLVSRIQSELTAETINFAVLKDHSLAGLSGCLKNYYGVIHNPNKYHEDLCNPFLADLYGLEVIRGKQRLAICDALRVQYHGGPGFVSRWAATYGSILVSTDAVALDRVAAEIVDRLRTKNGLPRLKDVQREPIHIRTAGENGLGQHRLEDIEWITVNV